MEAVVIFIFFGIYIAIRILFGGGETNWEKQLKNYSEGITLFKKKNYVAAKSYFVKRLKKRPFESLHLVMLGEIELFEGNFEKALYYGEKALRLDNTVPEVHLLICKGFYGLGEFDLALTNARKASWFGRKSAEANRWYGLLLVEKGDVENGLQHLSVAYSLGDEDAGYVIKSGKSDKKNWF
jgi:tetratricopeptide (TPR) repeat protein